MAVTILVEMNFVGTGWTDVSAYLESEVTVTGGRQDELSQADPNQCAFALDNRDGRFTPGKSGTAYYPYVKVGVPVRVSADVDGSGSSRRFTGYVDSWQVDWADGQDYCKVQVQASSIMARLGLISERRSAVEEEILVDSPTIYYPLSEAPGATSAFNESGVSSGDLRLDGDGSPVVFGNAVGPPADGLPAAQFYGGQFLTASSLPSFALRTLEVFFLANPGAVTGSGSLFLQSGSSLSLGINGTTGVLQSAAVSAGTAPIDGRVHHAVVTWNAGTETLYVDGVAVGSASSADPGVVTSLNVGSVLGATVTSAIVIAHAAAYTTPLSAARISEHYYAGMTGFQGETVAARLARYATWGKVTSYTTTSTVMPVAADVYAGAALVDLLHNLETAEGGVLYDARDNNLTLLSRQSRLTATTAVTFDASSEQLQSSYSPVTDRQVLANEVTVTGGDGTVAKVTDTTSQTSYGVARTEIAVLTTEPQSPLARAQWEVYARATPRERVPTLGVDVLNCGIAPTTLLALTVGSRVAVTNLPSQAVGAGDYFIEGWSETFEPSSYEITFNVSPAQPWVNTLILDDATKGVLDSTYVLA